MAKEETIVENKNKNYILPSHKDTGRMFYGEMRQTWNYLQRYIKSMF